MSAGKPETEFRRASKGERVAFAKWKVSRSAHDFQAWQHASARKDRAVTAWLVALEAMEFELAAQHRAYRDEFSAWGV